MGEAPGWGPALQSTAIAVGTGDAFEVLGVPVVVVVAAALAVLGNIEFRPLSATPPEQPAKQTAATRTSEELRLACSRRGTLAIMPERIPLPASTMAPKQLDR